MKKKFLSAIMAITMVLMLLPVTAWATNDSGSCGASITWSYSDGTLSIQGSSGMMDSYAFGSIDDNYLGTIAPPWYVYHDQIHTIIVNDGVMRIGSFAFCNCNNLTSVTIPQSVTFITDYAFYGCSSLADVYYGGSEEQWKSLHIYDPGNDSLTSATIHYNYQENSGGSGVPNPPSQEDQHTTELLLAKFKAIDVFTNTIYFYDNVSTGTELRYKIADGATLNVNGLLNKWVVCEILTTSQGEKLLSMQPVQIERYISFYITPIPDINYKEGQMSGQDNAYYKIDKFVIPVEVAIKYNVKLKNPDPTKVSDAMLEVWTNIVSNDTDLGIIVNSVVLEAPTGFNFDGNSKELVGGDHDILIPVGHQLVIQGGLNVNKTYEPFSRVERYKIRGTLQTAYGTETFDIPFTIHDAERSNYNLPSGSNVVSNEDLLNLNDYFDEWLDAFNHFIEVVGEEIGKVQDKNASSSIEDQAKALMEADNKSTSRYLTFSPGFPSKYRIYAYQALCSSLLKVTNKQIDFSKVKLNDYYSANTGIVTEIAKKLSSVHESYVFDDLTVEVEMFSFSGANFGSIVCTDNSSGKEYTPIVICSGLTSVNKLVASYLTELSKLEYRAVNGVYAAYAKDILGKPLSELTEKYLARKVSEFMQKRLDNIKVKGFLYIVGDCYAFYKHYNDFYKKIKKVDYHELDKIVGSLDIKDDMVRNTNAKKAVEVLKKAQDSLVTAVNQYVTTGKVTTLNKNPLAEFVSWFSCPVNISIFSNGKQIGYVGDDDVWYSEEIYAVERGGAKIIHSELGVPLTFEVTGTENGTVSYTVEERVNGIPTGRLNYYDLPVSNGTKYTFNLSGGEISENQKSVNVTTGGQNISASEYISSDTDACVIINARENDSDRGVIIGEGAYVRGNSVVLYAYPGEGYIFSGWYNEAGAIVSTKSAFEFVARDDLTLIAQFDPYDDSKDEDEPQWKNPYNDVSKTAWYYNSVVYVSQRRLMTGKTSKMFAPNDTATRAEVSTVLWRMDDELQANLALQYTDVKENAWYTEAIRWATAADVVRGYGDNKFGPNDSVTREQFATMLYRYAQYKNLDIKVLGNPLARFPDASKVGSWAKDAMAWAVDRGIITGADGKLDPKGSAVRAQLTAMIERFDKFS